MLKSSSKIVFTLIFIAISLISCAKNSNFSTVSLLSESDKALQKEAKIDISIKNKDQREELKPIDFSKSYQEMERYFRFASSWKKLQCVPKSGFVCTKHECKKIAADSFLTIDREKDLVKKCENDVCESYPVEITQLGVFVNVQSTGAIGSLIRILGDSRYKEISTVGLDAHIANGNCSTTIDSKVN